MVAKYLADCEFRDRRVVLSHIRSKDRTPERMPEYCLMVANFMGRGNVCAVIELHADNREEVVQEGLYPIETGILCAGEGGGYSARTRIMAVAGTAPESPQ
jgi:hypothetical protein